MSRPTFDDDGDCHDPDEHDYTDDAFGTFPYLNQFLLLFVSQALAVASRTKAQLQ